MNRNATGKDPAKCRAMTLKGRQCRVKPWKDGYCHQHHQRSKKIANRPPLKPYLCQYRTRKGQCLRPPKLGDYCPLHAGIITERCQVTVRTQPRSLING